MRVRSVYLPQKRVRKRATQVRSEWSENHRFWVTFWTNYHGFVDFSILNFDTKKSWKNHRKIMKFHRKIDRKIIDFDRKFCTPKCDVFMCIYRKSECETERHKFDPNGRKIIDFELLFERITSGVLNFSIANLMQKSSKIIEKSWNFIEKLIEKSSILIENLVPQNARYLNVFTAKASAKASEINFP